MADPAALRMRRSRAHAAGDHDLCIIGRCKALGPSPEQQATDQATAELAAAVLEEFPESDRLSRALALRLATLSGGKGPAAVQAARALGELVAWQRGDPP
jgi:hypothetical protein